jgi:hypothetical protein
MRRKPNRGFGRVVDFLNQQKIGTTFNSKQVSEQLKGVVPSTCYLYLKNLEILKYLEKTNTRPILYTIVARIPDELNTVILGQILTEILYRPSWKDWFMEMDHRIKILYHKQYGEGGENW